MNRRNLLLNDRVIKTLSSQFRDEFTQKTNLGGSYVSSIGGPTKEEVSELTPFK